MVQLPCEMFQISKINAKGTYKVDYDANCVVISISGAFFAYEMRTFSIKFPR